MKMTKLSETKLTIRFKTALSANHIILPKSASTKLPEEKKITIEGTINTIPFRAALTHGDKGTHWLKVSKAMCVALSTNVVDAVTIEITRVGDESETRVPIDLLKALKATPKALTSWTDITPLARRDWIFSICEATQAETRKRRIEKACDMLKSGKRRLCCFPGIKWAMKKDAKIFGMWLPLPK